MKKKKKIISFLIIPAVLLIYMFVCFGCYFFEPSYFNYADLDLASPSFERYKFFDKNIDDKLYIKQIDKNDICSYSDKRLKYVKNTAIVIAARNASYQDIENTARSVNATICGYIECISFYQFEYNDISYDELITNCESLNSNALIEQALPDYFEETPSSDSPDESVTDINGYIDALEFTDAYSAWKYSDDLEPVNVGIIDGMVDYTNNDISVVNFDEYTRQQIYQPEYLPSSNHATHIAGVISAEHNNSFGIDGICESARLYSYNGINNTLSYWVASLCRMISVQNVKAVNISMGYNTFVVISASMGDKISFSYVENENHLFESVLERLIDNGNEFVICVSAGNSAKSTLYRDFFGYFGYGDKSVLRKIDIFGLFDTPRNAADARYDLFFTDIDNKKVRDRIIIVGSVDTNGNCSGFLTNGDVIDIVAPSEKIYSTVTGGNCREMTGTSMAAPFVTGTAAMLFALDTSLSGADVKNIIVSSAKVSAVNGSFSYPVLNVGDAVEYIMNGAFQ